MSLKKKLLHIKDNILDKAEEINRTLTMPLEDYLELYGASYKNYVNVVKKRIFKVMSETNSNDVYISLKIAQHNGDIIQFADPEFGKLETFSYSRLKSIAFKLQQDIVIDKEKQELIIHSKNAYIEFKETTNEYLGMIKDVAQPIKDELSANTAKIKDGINHGKEEAGKSLKREINKLADWANEKL